MRTTRTNRSRSNNHVTVATIVSEYRGIYNRIAKNTGVDPSYVSRIARGERTNSTVEAALVKELNRLHGLSTKLIRR